MEEQSGEPGRVLWGSGPLSISATRFINCTSIHRALGTEQGAELPRSTRWTWFPFSQSGQPRPCSSECGRKAEQLLDLFFHLLRTNVIQGLLGIGCTLGEQPLIPALQGSSGGWTGTRVDPPTAVLSALTGTHPGHSARDTQRPKHELNLEKSGTTPCRRWHWNHREDRGAV